MKQAELDLIKLMFDSELPTRFPGAPIQGVEVLQHGEEPTIEPGQLLVRITLEEPAGASEGGTEAQRRARMDEFHSAHHDAIREMRRDLEKLPAAAMLEVVVGGQSPENNCGPFIRLAHAPRGPGAGPEAQGLTPVMARLGQQDLETLDTLITAGIAASRAEAVRWALARIRERPAYEQLRSRASEIEELKAQF